MKLEQQVVSLELAKKMKELGFLQESLYKWNIPNVEEEKRLVGVENFDIDSYPKKEIFPTLFTQKEWEEFTENYNPIASDMVSCFTVAELGEMLPIWTDTYKATKGFHCKFWTGKPDPLRGESVSRHYTTFADTEADARAKMLIYLKENNL